MPHPELSDIEKEYLASRTPDDRKAYLRQRSAIAAAYAWLFADARYRLAAQEEVDGGEKFDAV